MTQITTIFVTFRELFQPLFMYNRLFFRPLHHLTNPLMSAMRRILYLFIYITLLQIAPLRVTAQPALSLLTCGQGDDIYTLFGHTAIRYADPVQGTDLVFNYGVFDFDTPQFALRFALGETDYQLGLNRFDHFCAIYSYHGRTVWEQPLNLTPSEQQRLIQLLQENYRPENRMYRYNFFYDNCATRPRDLIERAVEGKIRYAQPMEQPTDSLSYRTFIHRYSQGHPWSRLGMDLCLGAKADRPITLRQREFVPFCLMEDFAHAEIEDPEGNLRPLTGAVRLIVAGKEQSPQDALHASEVTDWPLHLARILLFLIVIPLTLWSEFFRQRACWMLDLLLLLSAGVAGCILAFLATLSSHPCVDSNWLLLALHPLHLLCLPCAIRRLRKGLLSRYQVANFAILTLFIIVFLLKLQLIPTTAVYLALALWIRAAAHLYLHRKTYLRQSLHNK